jgi:hypothetical protein
VSLSFVQLLLHEAELPETARAALQRATGAPETERRTHLIEAARSLRTDAQLDCADAWELVGLD